MRGFELSRRARDDLVDIGLFGAARWGDERSERYVTDLYRVFQRLVDGRAFPGNAPRNPCVNAPADARPHYAFQ